MPLLAALSALILGAVTVVRRRRGRRELPAIASIMSPRKSTDVAEDGAVRSVQSAEFTIRESELDRLWTPENLENLARTYWRFLSRVTLGMIRVVYGPDDRRVALLTPRLTLLRFHPPEYLIETGHGRVQWMIKDGLLVTRSGRNSGCLEIDVRRTTPPHLDGQEVPDALARVYCEISVANFYPSLASGIGLRFYMATQSWIHVLVTHGFLRSLAHLTLDQSSIGVLRDAVVGAVSAQQR